MTSSYDFAESTATLHLDLEINDDQSKHLLASPLFPQEREASGDRSQVYHSHRENLVTDSSRLQTSTERPVALGHSEAERNFRSIFEEQRQQVLSEAHSEILKQKNAELRKLRQLFVNFIDRYNRIVWTWAAPTRSHEENEYNNTKNGLFK